MPIEFAVPPTDAQRVLEEEVAKEFCSRLYNNTINKQHVYTGAKEGKWATRRKGK